jgi:hypothetical protein
VALVCTSFVISDKHLFMALFAHYDEATGFLTWTAHPSCSVWLTLAQMSVSSDG